MTTAQSDRPDFVRVARHWWVGLPVGAAAAAVGLYAMSYPYQAWLRALSQQEVGDHRLAVLWLLLLGAGLFAITAASRHNPLIAAIPAIVWIAVYGPFLFSLQFPGWSPSWVSSWVLPSLGAHIPVIIGMVTAAAIWNGWITLSHSVRANG